MDISTIDIWILWGIVAVGCFIVEIFLPSFWMAMLGIGAIGASVASGFGGGTEIQIATFSVLSVITGVFFRPIAFRYIYKGGDNRAANVDALIGKRVKVIEAIKPEKQGKVKIGSEVWKAVAKDETCSFKEGEFVTIASIDGAKVVVKSAQPD